MWGHYVELALRSGQRSKALTALVVILLAVGVSACMVSYAAFRATTSDPMPGKSSRLFVPMTQSREEAYAGDRSVAALMSIVCGLLLLATAGGIVGLSSFWVSQRRKQIGIRRSLGATSGDILGYFHVENFVLVSMGIVLGAVLAVAANISIMNNYPLPRMPLYVPVLGAAVLWLVGQVAVWVPARSAARVPPVVAMRTA
jgi:putative ABC transport system permease protein